eukprot:TRINITY_DN13939_c0_g2_i1.p1 TRINITY_DN13939_c0_g2~~TRINITY_DN13939_c0_g2_i1.p1  ORF type:complete len:251 (-),score=43.30 TRINITY_DN13939_c0_g2_i1:101-853(-)
MKSQNEEDKGSEDKAKKSCSCKMSKCLKLYCECFASKTFCRDCNCVGCENTPQNTDQRSTAIESLLKRNPKAFQTKKQKAKVAEVQSENQAPTSGLPRGCKCRKTSCMKKYCECFNRGLKCTSHCFCEGCLNCEKKKEEFVRPKAKSFIAEDKREKPFFSQEKVESSNNSVSNNNILVNLSSRPYKKTQIGMFNSFLELTPSSINQSLQSEEVTAVQSKEAPPKSLGEVKGRKLVTFGAFSNFSVGSNHL